METGKIKSRPFFLAFLFCGAWTVAGLPLQAGTLAFSKPQKLATLPWSNGSNHGLSPQGSEWLIVDQRGRFILENERDFDFFSPRGRYLQALSPIDKSVNFFGFTSMEVLPDGSIALLARSESPLEQRAKDNFEERAKPGSRLIVLSPEGKVTLDKEEVDSRQPHSHYFLQDGTVYSIHEDGTYETLDSIHPPEAKRSSFEDFAALGFNLARWQEHVKKLSVYRAESKNYHDVKGRPHEDKGALAYLMGRRFVEGTGGIAERDGRIYVQVLCDLNQQFIDAIFVEDLKAQNYGFIELISPDDDLNAAHDHAVFVDKRGNLFEGVAKKDGYRIYEWRLIR